MGCEARGGLLVGCSCFVCNFSGLFAVLGGTVGDGCFGKRVRYGKILRTCLLWRGEAVKGGGVGGVGGGGWWLVFPLNIGILFLIYRIIKFPIYLHAEKKIDSLYDIERGCPSIACAESQTWCLGAPLILLSGNLR